MTHVDASGLPLPIGRPAAPAGPRRRLFRKRWLLVLLIPVLMFSGAVIGLYFQPPALRAFHAATGLRPGGGASVPIALPPDVELPKEMAETMRPSDVLGLARLMPQGDLSPVAAPYGAGDARLADILVAEGTGWRRARWPPGSTTTTSCKAPSCRPRPRWRSARPR